MLGRSDFASEMLALGSGKLVRGYEEPDCGSERFVRSDLGVDRPDLT